jgi:hypothetical protein
MYTIERLLLHGMVGLWFYDIRPERAGKVQPSSLQHSKQPKSRRHDHSTITRNIDTNIKWTLACGSLLNWLMISALSGLSSFDLTEDMICLEREGQAEQDADSGSQ